MIETTITSRDVYCGRVIDVRVDQVRLADGSLANREIVSHCGSAAIVAVDQRQRVLIISQYRHAAGQELWELPAGRVDPGEVPSETAARELQEEAGVQAASLEPLADFYVSPGYATERLHVFIARDLRTCPATPDEDERITCSWIDLPEAVSMCLDGRIIDAKTIAGILAATFRLGLRP